MMSRTRAIRISVIAVCVGGIIGMIVTSATNHNGAAVTFGLVTAVAILCQMTATTVLNEVTGAPGAPIGDADRDAAELEERISGLVAAGADEQAVRDLVRHAVRLGRRMEPAAPPDS
jgi:hypothetical protein